MSSNETKKNRLPYSQSWSFAVAYACVQVAVYHTTPQINHQWFVGHVARIVLQSLVTDIVIVVVMKQMQLLSNSQLAQVIFVILASRSRNVLQAEAKWPVVFKMGMHVCVRHQSFFNSRTLVV